MHKKTKIANAVETLQSVETESDRRYMDYITTEKFQWEDLHVMRNEIGENISVFIENVSAILKNQQIMENLGENANEFDKLVSMFFSDIEKFSVEMAALNVQFENKFGVITTIDDYTLYNDLAVAYHFKTSDMVALTQCTIGQIISICLEVEAMLAEQQNTTQGVIDAEVLSTTNKDGTTETLDGTE